jgi:hypothetical protein
MHPLNDPVNKYIGSLLNIDGLPRTISVHSAFHCFEDVSFFPKKFPVNRGRRSSTIQ